MANYGSYTHTRGDPIYGIEVTYACGDTAFKTFPSLSGLKASLRELDKEIARWGDCVFVGGFVPVSREILITTPTWSVFTP